MDEQETKRENIGAGLEMMEEACCDVRARLMNEGTSLESIERRFVIEAEHAVKQIQSKGRYKN